VLVLAALGLTAGPAAAHGDEGTMEVVTAEPGAPLTVTVEVGLLYANDDDLATEATVAVILTGPDGTTIGPVDVPLDRDAIYATAIEVPGPGTWTLAFTAENPAATATATVEVTEAPSTTEAPPTTGAPPTTETTSTDPTTSAAPPTTGEGADADSDDDSSSALPLLLGAAAVVIVGGGLLLFLRARNGSAAP
jgi:hypothetical protein